MKKIKLLIMAFTALSLFSTHAFCEVLVVKKNLKPSHEAKTKGRIPTHKIKEEKQVGYKYDPNASAGSDLFDAIDKDASFEEIASDEIKRTNKE